MKCEGLLQGAMHLEFLSAPMIYSGRSTKLSSRYDRAVRIKDSDISSDYKDFGYDYFDKPTDQYQPGYGGFYDDDRYRHSIASLCKNLSLNKNSRVLDYGCAKGFMLTVFLDYVGEVFGVEKSMYAIQNSHPKIQPFICSPRNFHVNDHKEAFDLIICRDVIPHMKLVSARELIKKLVYCLKKSSTLYIEIQVLRPETEPRLLKQFDPNHVIAWTATPWKEWITSNVKHDPRIKVYLKEIL